MLGLSSSEVLERDGDDATAHVALSEGDQAGFVLDATAGATPQRVKRDELQALFEATNGYWHDWVERGRYRGRWRETVYRSAITLKPVSYTHLFCEERTENSVAPETAKAMPMPPADRAWVLSRLDAR